MKKLLFIALISLIFTNINAENKQKLTWDDVVSWERITDKQISDDGKYIAVTTSPWKGDATLKLYNNKGETLFDLKCGNSAQFLNNNTLVYLIAPTQEVLDSLERAKSKQKVLSILGIYDIKNNKSIILDTIKSHIVAKDSETIIYQVKNTLKFFNKSSKFNNIEGVKDYKVSFDASAVAFSSDSLPYTVNKIDLTSLEEKEIFSGNNTIERLDISNFKNGNISFITNNKLYFYSDSLHNVAMPENSPEGWIFSTNAKLEFSKDGKRLIFGTSPQPKAKDTLTLGSNKAIVDIWHWNEQTLHTQQLVNASREKKRSYRAIYFTDSKISKQLATKAVPSVSFQEDFAGDKVLINNSSNYQLETMWTGSSRYDISLLDLNTSEETVIAKGFEAPARFSPKGNYLYWYLPSDSTWYCYSIAQDKKFVLASPKDFITYDDINDVPDYPSAQSSLLWSEDDSSVLAFGKYDIWKLSPTSEHKPQNLTKVGKELNLRLRVLSLEEEEEYYNNKSKLFISTFNLETKSSGFATLDLAKNKFKLLVQDDIKFGTPLKAKDKNIILLSKETFETAPDLYLYTLDMKKGVRITDISPQQKNFNWGSVELISWTSLKGDTLQGLLYKPENFDPNKKYPLICNFYEKYSYTRFSYRTPEPNRSTIDYHYYTSNGYVIFNPDIKYYDGHPGQSCYDAVMPGLDKVIAEGYIDEDRIGAQGHSWGGYQVAHLATVTDRFAAIESGAPVVNMFSAYGGIRWQTGRTRAFQYEKGQSRIGASIWEAPELYIENSPLMNMDKVQTPILIMHNDKDGHVPWWQGIEYFVALRRLQKPVWLLNYNNEPHWPLRLANKIDFQKRMSQFFNHFLKGEPAPEWLEKGVPAV